MDDDANSRDDVIPDTVSDEPLPNTGGVPLSGLLVVEPFLLAFGLLLLGRSALQPASTSARRRSAK